MSKDDIQALWEQRDENHKELVTKIEEVKAEVEEVKAKLDEKADKVDPDEAATIGG